LADEIKFLAAYRSAFSFAPYKMDSTDKEEIALASEWRTFIERIKDDEVKHVISLGERLSKRSKASLLDLERALKQVRNDSTITPVRKSIPDCALCSCGMMEVPFYKMESEGYNGEARWDVEVGINEKAKRIETCHVPCKCAAGEAQAEYCNLIGYHFMPDFRERGHSFLTTTKSTLLSRYNRIKNDAEVDNAEKEMRRRHSLYLNEYFDYAITKINGKGK